MPADVTQLIAAAHGGDAAALQELFTHVYGELKRLARGQLARRGGPRGATPTLNTTGLVHEVYLKLAPHGESLPDDRAHFFALAARAMRQIVVDHALRRSAQKRGGPNAARAQMELADDVTGSDWSPDELLRVDDALGRFEQDEPELARLIELRVFAGLELEQIAALQGVTVRTVQRDWRHAKVQLYLALDVA
ncbi:MAG: RNA polymerase subunit sigma [Proteobacteria bacterium]|nr:RNA polymerase subunit sigma [Pseudomonadota bacterium]MBS0460956.1 RNA polymerase subunit sigma [Pseudomonadota bacterium]